MEKLEPKQKLFIGIDPGKSGGIAALLPDGQVYLTAKLSETEKDIAEVLKSLDASFTHWPSALLEKVHAMPKQGVSSSFTFGKGYGFLRGLLTALEIPFDDVTPQAWQKAMSCMTGGNKNVSKQRAQQLFPKVKVCHAIADSLLIAEYLRRKENA